MPLQISDRVRALGAQAQDALTEQFARIDAIAEYNTQKGSLRLPNTQSGGIYVPGNHWLRL